MKLDATLLLTILQKVEDSSGPFVGSKVEIPGYTREQICEHVLIAQDQGLVDARMPGNGVDFTVKRLTAAGHDYLETHATVRKTDAAVTHKLQLR
jgi:Hypothetical protein (DUF2513)